MEENSDQKIPITLEFVGGIFDGANLDMTIHPKFIGPMKFPIHNGRLNKLSTPTDLIYSEVGGEYRWERYIVGKNPAGKWFAVEANFYEHITQG